MKKKKCNICGLNKQLSDYPRDNTLKTGFRGKCKQCSNTECRSYYSKNKIQISKTRKAYNSLKSTQHELSSRINQQRLDESIEALKSGKKLKKKLSDG